MIILGAGERHACVVQRIKPERSRRARDPSRPWKKNPAISRPTSWSTPRNDKSEIVTLASTHLAALGNVRRRRRDGRGRPAVVLGFCGLRRFRVRRQERSARPRGRAPAGGGSRSPSDPRSPRRPRPRHGRDLLSHGRPAPPRRHRGHPRSWLVHHLPVAPLPDLHVHGRAPLPGHGPPDVHPPEEAARARRRRDRRRSSRQTQRRRETPEPAPRDETPAAPRTPQIRMGERQVRVQTPAAVATVERRRAGRGGLAEVGARLRKSRRSGRGWSQRAKVSGGREWTPSRSSRARSG